MKKQILVSGLSLLVGMGMASTASAFNFEFHGKMWQTIGGTDNDQALQGKLKSGKTNYFGYTNLDGDEQLNVKGAEKKSYYDIMGDDGGTSVTFGLTKARLRFEGNTDDGRAKFVYGLEVGTVNWGDKEKGFGLSGDGVNQETRFAYAQIQVPGLNQNHYVRAGLQTTKINHWLWTETAAGLTYHGKANASKWMAGWYRGDEDRAGNSSDNDYFVLKGSTKITSDINMGLFGVYVNAGDEDTYGITDLDFTEGTQDQYDDKTYYIGLTGELNGPIFGSFDLIYQGGNVKFDTDYLEDLDHSAYLGDITVGYKIDDRFKVYANFLYVSGDDDYSDNDADNFNSIDVDVKVGIILTKDSLLGDCDRFVSDSPYIMDQGLINYSITGEFQLNQENHFRGAVRYLQLAEDFALGDDDIGTELDFWYKYKYNKNVALRFEAAYLFAGDALAFEGDADDMYTLAAGIQFKF